MILRKPYAFLIKNFKLLHAIMLVLMGLVLYKTLDILSAFDDFFTSQAVLLNSDIPELVYPASLFIMPIFIIVVSIILLWTMLVKNKPYKLYIVNIAVYFAVIILFIFGKSMFVNMTTNIVDVRAVKLIRDLITMGFIAQMYPLVKCLVRAVGFDIKQFDFGKDLAELEIEEKDNEEVEVQVNVDTNKMKRGLNYHLRNLKYFYKEHKFWFRVGVAIIVLIIGAVIGIGIYNANKSSGLNVPFNMNGLNIKVTNAFVTRKSYNGNTLTNLNTGSSLVVIPVEIKNNGSMDRHLETANIELTIGNHKYRNNLLYKDSVADLGTIYNKETISPNTVEYRILTFIVPTEYINKGLRLKFITSISFKNTEVDPTYVSFKINPINLDEISSRLDIDGELEVNSNVFKGSTFTISNIEVAKRFRIDYKYSIDNEKLSGYEYVSAPLDTSVDRVLLKISGVVNTVEGVSFNSLYDLIDRYGVVKYTIGEKIKTISNLPKVNPSMTKSDKTIYVAAPSDIMDAESINLILTIRGKEYTYKVK